MLARSGVDRRDRVLGAEGARIARRGHRRRCGRRASSAAALPIAIGIRSKLFCSGHRVVGDPDLVHGAEERGTDRDREHRHERDEGEPDHQRTLRSTPVRCGFRRRVLAREDAGRPREPVARHAEHGGERPDQLSREERNADEDEHGADAHEEEDLARAVRTEQPVGEQRGTRAPRAAPSPSARYFAKRPGGSVAPSRTAAIGGTASRGAPGAGWRASSRGSRRASETITVRGLRSSPVFGSVKPACSKSQNRSLASAEPEEEPDRGRRATPMTNDSSRTERSIWRRDAPIVRSVANSRVRCAIVIESEFAITNAPTKSAMPPNASRKFCRKLVNAFVSLASVSAWPSPLRTCVCWRQDRRGSGASSAASPTPGFLATRIWSSLPFLLEQALRGREVEAGERRAADVEPAGAELDEPGDPERLSRRPAPRRRIGSPTSMCFLPAVERSITTSPVFGQAALDERERVELGLASGRPRTRGAAPRRS